MPPDAPGPDPEAKAPHPPAARDFPGPAAAWLDAVADGVLVQLPDGTPLHVNPALCALTGYSKEELLGLRLQDVLPAEEAARADSFRADRVAGRPAPITYPLTLLRKDGTSLPVRISVGQAAWRGHLAVIAVVRDVSEQHRLQEELRRLAGRDRPAGDDATDVFVRVAPDGAVLYANPSYCRMVGLSQSEVVGRDVVSLAPEPYRENARRRIEALYRDPRVSVSEAEMVLPDGVAQWYEWTTRGLVDAQKRVVEFEITGRDITRARRAEEALKRRDAILESVAFAAERLLGSTSWEERIDEILERFRLATGVTRVHLWECDIAPDGDVRFAVRHRADPEPPPPGRTLAEAPVLSSREAGIFEWLEPLRRNEPIRGPLPEHPRSLHDFLQRQRIRSLMAVPVHAGGRWWGCIGFTDERPGRDWSSTETDALRVAGSILGAHIHRESIAKALLSSEERYRTLIEGSSVPIAVLDMDATYLFVNSAGARALGFAVSEIVGRSLADFFPGGDIAATRANLKKAAQSRMPLTVTVKNTLRGQSLWSEARLVPLPRTTGQPDAVLVIIADVTERMEAETALRESERRFHEMFETMAEGVVLIDTDGRIVKANAAAERILGLERSEIVGRHYMAPEWRIVRPDRTPMPPEEMAGPRAMREKRRVEGLVMGVERVDGSLVWISVSAAPLMDEAGRLQGIVGVFTDVTARLRVEEEIAAHQEKLRSLALELAVTEQRERRRIAQELHDRIGQALAVSKMRLDAAARSAPPGETANALQEARALIDETIDDTRALTFDLSPPILHEFGIGAALEWLCERFGAEHSLRITYLSDGRDHKLDADLQGFVFQAARELLMNVAKHAAAQTVRVSLERVGADIVLSVADDGVGLPEGFASRAARESAGFGLFSIRERVQHLAGRLDIDSRAGAGCCVTLRLPARRGPALRKGRRSPA